MLDVSSHVALALKDLRKKRDWSLDKTAQETGVSKAMLGQIERAESSPTIATLWKIAKGFNVPFSLFLGDGEVNFSSGQTLALNPAEDKIRVLPLFPYDDKLRCEIFMIELLAGCEHFSAPHENGVIEHVLVIEGSMEILINNSWKSVSKGQGIRFNAAQPHGYRNLTRKKAIMHNVIHYTEAD